MLPLTLLKTSENSPILIELKNGDTYNGHLVSCNMFMNITMRDVVCTSRNGDRFWKMPECYIRGNSIKYLRIPDEIIDLVSADEQNARKFSTAGRGGGRGGRGGRVPGGNTGGRFAQGSNGGRTGGRGEGGRGRGRGEGRGAGRGEGRGAGRGASAPRTDAKISCKIAL